MAIASLRLIKMELKQHLHTAFTTFTKAAVAFVYHHNNIYPTAVTVTLIKNIGSIYTQ